MINNGSCGLHINHGPFKTGVEVTDWNMKGSFQVVHDTPA